MKKRLLKLAALVAALGVAGFLVAASGVIPIRASSGHWAITQGVLRFSMRRSIATHSMSVVVPPLDDPGLVLRGAGHYELGCAPCHGSPSRPLPRVARAMTPMPPYLPPTISHWGPEELFEIVKHGIKLTGMPAWPSQQRDDEVWAMVAFLRALPRLDEAAYRRLVDGEIPTSGDGVTLGELPRPAVPAATVESCARCHGARGEGRGAGAFPALAGQRSGYFLASMDAYARGARHSGVMEPVAAELRPEHRRELARYYASLQTSERALPRRSAEAMASIERGAEIARRGVPMQRVPACVSCHGPGDGPRNPIYPQIVGQHAGYLALQLELFKAEHRGGTPYARLMRVVARALTREQMRDVTRYYESLGVGARAHGAP